MKSSIARCIVVGEDIINGKKAGTRSVRDIKTIGSRVLEVTANNIGHVEDENGVAHKEKAECGQSLFRKNSPSTFSSPSETFTKSRRVRGVTGYSAFRFEASHSVDLILSKLVE